MLAKILLLADPLAASSATGRRWRRCGFDLRWKFALGLPSTTRASTRPAWSSFAPACSSLHGKERVVFERSLELASELGLISGRAEQILDSTPMLGAAAVQDTVTLVRSSVRKLLDAVAVVDSQAARELRSGLRFEYSRPRAKPEGDSAPRRSPAAAGRGGTGCRAGAASGRARRAADRSARDR